MALPGGGHGTTLSANEKVPLPGRSIEDEPTNTTVAVELIFGFTVTNTVIPTGLKEGGTPGLVTVISGAAPFVPTTTPTTSVSSKNPTKHEGAKVPPKGA